ncbi:hypothetical protein V8J88_21290 [Massilia sp. W12]|uniref:hypothetical protein n=1 Tax=Massilia sp. W12 TaxID=3126507 RepID=UPI0030CE7DD8
MSSEPSIPLPEFRELIRCARAYVAGDLHFSYVCSAAGAFRDVTKVLPVNREIKQIAEEWAEMATRAWPEMAQIANPISEDDFLKWVSEKMNVFQPVNFPNAQ